MSEAQQTHFQIHKIYLKDVSLESPKAPEVFKIANWQPQVGMQINNEARQLDEDNFEVVLTVTVTVTQDNNTLYLVEVHQAGIFAIKGFNDAQKGHLLGSVCPGTLFPFAREAVADLVAKAGFPQLLLSPVNFDAMYAQHLQRQAEAAAKAQDNASTLQ